MATRSGRRRLVCCCALTALFWALAGRAPAAREYRTAEFDFLKITIDSDWVPRAAPGYVPVRFEITNLGDARVIELAGSSSRSFRMPRGGGAGASGSFRQTVTLAKGDHVRLSMAIPVFADSESLWFEIRENNHQIGRFNYLSFQSRMPANEASALFVGEPNTTFGTVALRVMRTGSGRSSFPSVVVTVPGVTASRSSGTLSGPPLDYLLEPSRLPTNWLGFTSVRAVVIGPAEWAQLNDAQHDALLAWTAAGGDLLLVDGYLSLIHSSLRVQPSGDADRRIARYFFGRVQAVSSASLESGGLGPLFTTGEGRDPRWALPANTALDWGTMESRGFRLRIPGIEGVPARVYLAILLLFSVLIGPANYWWLRRRRRLVLLVFTIPAISVVFIALLTAYAVAGEGFGVQGRAVTFTVLDQARKQAATRASVSLYAAGLTPADGLRFGSDVAVYPLGQDGYGSRDTIALDLTDSQRFSRGVLQVRAPTNFDQVTFRQARERLTFTHDAGGVSVANGFESSVLALLYRDGDTLYRMNDALPQGATRTMTATRFDGKATMPAGVTIPAKFLDLVERLPAGSYLAILDRSPFWEPGVAGLVERASAHIVHGWPEGQQ